MTGAHYVTKCKILLFIIYTFWICSSEIFALIRVIDSSIQRAGRVVLLLLQFVRRADNCFGYGSGYASNFFVLHNCQFCT